MSGVFCGRYGWQQWQILIAINSLCSCSTQIFLNLSENISADKLLSSIQQRNIHSFKIQITLNFIKNKMMGYFTLDEKWHIDIIIMFLAQCLAENIVEQTQ